MTIKLLMIIQKTKFSTHISVEGLHTLLVSLFY